MSAVSAHAGDSQMRVGRCVSVPREMFHRGQHSSLVRALYVGRNQIADLFGIFSEGASIDDGIGRIRVHVGVREEIPVNTDGSRFMAGDEAESLGVFDVAIGSERHGGWKNSGPQKEIG